MSNFVTILKLNWLYFQACDNKVELLRVAMQRDAKRGLKVNAFFIVLFFVTLSTRHQDIFANALYLNLLWYLPSFYFAGLVREVNEECLANL